MAAPLTRFFGSVRTARRVLCSTTFLCAGGLLVISTAIHEPWIKMVAIGLASFCNDVVMPPAWGSCMDVGGRFSGTLSGAMNMTGNFGGVVFPVVTAFVLTHFGNNWNLVFYTSAISYVFAALLWMWIDPVTPIQKPEIELEA
jgi:MFS family permease